MTISDVLICLFLAIGGLFLLVGSIGLSRLPDFYMRLHAPTKASTLGIGAILIASILFYSSQEYGLSIKEFLITLFIFLTAPITAHMLSKAALHVRQKPVDGTLNMEYLESIRNRKSTLQSESNDANP